MYLSPIFTSYLEKRGVSSNDIYASPLLLYSIRCGSKMAAVSEFIELISLLRLHTGMHVEGSSI